MSDFEDDFRIFNQPLSLDASSGDLEQSSPSQSSYHRGSTPIPDDKRIQREQRSSLQELLESQSGWDAHEKLAQTKLPPPPPVPTLQADPADHKRKREEKGNKVAAVGKNLPPTKLSPKRGLSSKEAYRRGQPPRQSGGMTTELQP